MNDFIRYDVHVRESLLGDDAQQLVLSHADLTACVAGPFTDGPDHALGEDLRVPKICFKEKKLAARLQKAINSS